MPQGWSGIELASATNATPTTVSRAASMPLLRTASMPASRGPSISRTAAATTSTPPKIRIPVRHDPRATTVSATATTARTPR